MQKVCIGGSHDTPNVIFGYLLFNISIIMIEEENFKSALFCMNESIKYFDEKNLYIKMSCYYNLGVTNYAFEKYDEGIHHLEEAYRINHFNNLSIATRLNILDILTLAYLNKKHIMKAFFMTQKTIMLRNLSFDENQLYETTKRKFYISFIIDYLEHFFTTLRNNIICKIKYYY